MPHTRTLVRSVTSAAQMEAFLRDLQVPPAGAAGAPHHCTITLTPRADPLLAPHADPPEEILYYYRYDWSGISFWF